MSTDKFPTDNMLERVNNKPWRAVRELWIRVFGRYPILWWSIIIIVFVWASWSILSYLPILMPDQIKDPRLEKKISGSYGLTLFYPPRVTVGQDYPIDFVWNAETVQTPLQVELRPSWSGVMVAPTTFKISASEIGMLSKPITLRLQPVGTPPSEVHIDVRVTGDKPVQDALDISVTNPPQYLVQIIALLVSALAIGGKILLPLVIDLIKSLFKKSGGKQETSGTI